MELTRQCEDRRLDAGDITIQVVQAAQNSTVAVAGRVTVDSSPRLRAVLIEVFRRSKARGVSIDFSAVSYADLSGIATLIEALKTAREHSIRLRLIGISGQVKGLAEIAQLEKIFHVWGSEVESA